jgi:hypothetical protein
MTFIFSKIKVISSRRRVISSIYIVIYVSAMANTKYGSVAYNFKLMKITKKYYINRDKLHTS